MLSQLSGVPHLHADAVGFDPFAQELCLIPDGMQLYFTFKAICL